MQIRAPEAPREARRLRRPPLESGAANFCRLRAAARAVWPVGRAGTVASRAGFWGPGQYWPERMHAPCRGSHARN
eukprot:7111051-Alexandrium_andersonii.AAC.1